MDLQSFFSSFCSSQTRKKINGKKKKLKELEIKNCNSDDVSVFCWNKKLEL
jgi:hypothetical protein